MGVIPPFSAYAVDSEYKQLKAILLYQPNSRIGAVDNPKDVLHTKKIDYPAIKDEHEQIIKLYKKLKIKVYFVDFPRDTTDRCSLNLIYTRDLIFMTKTGAIISKMAKRVRKDETKYVKKTLRKINIPVIKTISGKGTFEGADALWVSNKLIMVGVGNRTNREGFLQLKEALKVQGVQCIAVPAARHTVHLLGAIQIIGPNAAFVRAELLDKEAFAVLKKHGMRIFKIPENNEVQEKQAMNFVVISAGKIIMPRDCPQTKKIYKKYKLKIAASVKINQLINGGGGLSCATAIIKRAL